MVHGAFAPSFIWRRRPWPPARVVASTQLVKIKYQYSSLKYRCKYPVLQPYPLRCEILRTPMVERLSSEAVAGRDDGASRPRLPRYTTQFTSKAPTLQSSRPGTRFTKHLTTVLRLSYDYAKVYTIDLRRTSNLPRFS